VEFSLLSLRRASTDPRLAGSSSGLYSGSLASLQYSACVAENSAAIAENQSTRMHSGVHIARENNEAISVLQVNYSVDIATR